MTSCLFRTLVICKRSICRLVLAYVPCSPLRTPASSPLHLTASQNVTVQDMREQMGKLTSLLRDERRSHQHSCQALLEEADRRAERVRQMHQLDMTQLVEAHNREIKTMVELHSKHMEEERNYAAERYALLDKDYDFLKSSFSTYKDSIAEEMRSSWLKKENSWREEQEKHLYEQMANLKKQLSQSEAEKEELKKAFEAQVAEIHGNYHSEIMGLKMELANKDMSVTVASSALGTAQFQLDVLSFNPEDDDTPKQELKRR